MFFFGLFLGFITELTVSLLYLEYKLLLMTGLKQPNSWPIHERPNRLRWETEKGQR